MPFLRKIRNSRKNNCCPADYKVRSQIAGLFCEQGPRIQRDAADDDCRPDDIHRGNRHAKHKVREHKPEYNAPCL